MKLYLGAGRGVNISREIHCYMFYIDIPRQEVGDRGQLGSVSVVLASPERCRAGEMALTGRHYRTVQRVGWQVASCF